MGLGAGCERRRVVEIGGDVVASVNGNQSVTTNTFTFTVTEESFHFLEIIYWDQGGDYQLQVELAGSDGSFHTLGSSEIPVSGSASNNNDYITNTSVDQAFFENVSATFDDRIASIKANAGGEDYDKVQGSFSDGNSSGLIGALLGGIFAIIFQPDIVLSVSGAESLTGAAAYKGIMTALTEGASVATPNEALNDLFSSGGMAGMLGTIWLIICALVFGGIMDAIGALGRISAALLSVTNSVFSLFAATVASCLAVNITASDQYLAIVVPGKMFSKAYEEKGLAPENLSRTLEDSGTVTSVLIPWNTCGAYQSSVLGVSVFDYFFYAIFNYISPFMTLLFAAFSIKIKQLAK